MRKQIESYIPRALAAIESQQIAKNGEVPKQFNGYIASFGASVRQAGLLATVLFYANEQSASEEDRKKVVDAIEEIIQEPIVLQDNTVKKGTRQKVEDAAVALKLAVRTYKLV